MRLDEADIDLHGFLRSFYSCNVLGRSFAMDHNVQRPVPSYVDFVYDKSNYFLILRELLRPLGLQLVQGKYIDVVVVRPPDPPERQTQLSFAPPVVSPVVVPGDSVSVAKADSAVFDSVEVVKPRFLRAKAFGILRSSARRMGLDYSEMIMEVSPSGVDRLRGRVKVNQLWHVAARASDSLGSLDFARVVDFVSLSDSVKIVFGGETRREEGKINYENGSSVIEYGSIFDGVTVSVVGESWFFLWRGEGSVLEVPGMVGSCASGSSGVSFVSRRGVPFLRKIPVLRYLFEFESKLNDDLFVFVCVEVRDVSF